MRMMFLPFMSNRLLSLRVMPLWGLCLRMWAGVLAGLVGLGGSVHAAEKPNVVFILADDLGWTDLGCQGSQYYETPHIDGLAAQGTRFLCHHHCQNCTPTRAALLSGQVPPRTGIYTVGELTRGSAELRKLVPPQNLTQLPLDRRTLADQLKAGGYATGIFGKWHIGQMGPYHPKHRGFDEAIITMGKHWNFETSPKVDVPKDVYLADWLTDRAVDFLERHQREAFFLYLPHFGVHSPFDAKPALEAKFKQKPGVAGHKDPTYAAMIASVDESVGRVLAKLDELKLSQNTIVIFASDNGGVGGYGELARGITENAPLRGGKGQHYEGGLRVPLIVRWPGVTKPGSTASVPTQHVDLFPTLLEATGAPKPQQVLDGESLVPVLREATAGLKREAIYSHLPGYLEGGAGRWRTTPVGSILAGDWKLLEFFEEGRLELYNLREDLGERQNLAEKLPEKARELQAKLAAWRKETGALMATPKPEGATRGKRQKRTK